MAELKGAAPVLIAHRGYSGRYPENTLLAYQAAYQHGARAMELDLQMTKDMVPVLHHDKTLLRLGGVDQDVRETKLKKFKSLSASYPSRFGDEFAENSFTTFRRYCKWLAEHKEVTTFVEIKQESIDYAGIPRFLDEVYRRILKTGVDDQCVIISFNPEVVEYTRKISSLRTAWVLPEWNEQVEQRLRQLNPDFAFAGTEQLPEDDEAIWQGPWQWAIYNLDTIDDAINMANRGIGFLETNEIGTLMADSSLANR